MRSDYILYGVAIIFFIVTGMALAYQAEPKEVWVVSTVVLGLFFLGLGYYQRPKPKKLEAVTTLAHPTPTTVEVTPPPPPTPPVQETVEMPASPPAPAIQETVEKPAPIVRDLTEVRGIGEKRAAQLKSVGINTVEE
ncbi:MAG: helix-hairpin-helix domain-containing protein, partial [Candidatus Bathyarchaeota archaeon]|nr:helix-hairpin-helix domain-containing protein [Candidatus Bathyarchaeota archaeon]